MSLRIANSEIISYDVKRYAADLKIHFENAESKINEYDQGFQGFAMVSKSIEILATKSALFDEKLNSALQQNSLTSKQIKTLNAQLLTLEKSFPRRKRNVFLVPGIGHCMLLLTLSVGMLPGFFQAWNMRLHYHPLLDFRNGTKDTVAQLTD